MEIYYFDTSALVKRYHSEKGTDIVSDIFSKEGIFIIASITLAEFNSVFVRKYNQKIIIEDIFHDIIKRFSFDSINEFWILDITRQDIERCTHLIIENNLRSLDGIQFSMLLKIRNANPKFVCSDKKLLKVAEKEGIEIINPEEPN